MKKLLFILSFASLTIVANAQWLSTNLNSGIAQCFAIKEDTIYTGTWNGVYLSSDNGNSWTLCGDTGLTNNQVYSLAMNDSGIYAATNTGGIFRSTNNGQLWSAMNYGIPSNSGVIRLSIYTLFSNGKYLFAGAEGSDSYPDDGLFFSNNYGRTWFDKGFFGINVYALAQKGDTLYAGTIGNGIYISTNAFTLIGTVWTAANNGLPLNSVINALAVSGNYIYAGTSDGVFVSSNNGSNWTAANTGLTNYNVLALGTDGNNVFAGIYGGGVFWSSNNGNNWVAINTGLTYYNLVVSLAVMGNNLFAGTNGGGVWKLPLSTLGIKEINNNVSNIAVYPNPAIKDLTIKTSQEATIEILNIQGQTILQQILQQGKTDIDISGLAKGVYILRLLSNDKTDVTKIVKE
jgi:hypothetical protein